MTGGRVAQQDGPVREGIPGKVRHGEFRFGGWGRFGVERKRAVQALGDPPCGRSGKVPPAKRRNLALPECHGVQSPQEQGLVVESPAAWAAAC